MRRSIAVVSMFVVLPLAAAPDPKPAAPDPKPAAPRSKPPAPGPKQDAARLEGQLDIITWVGAITRGDMDPAYDWVTGFEKDTGCKVNVKTAATSDEMVALMNNGVYDLVTASGGASLRLIAGKKVQPVDLARIPSYAKVDPRLQGAPWYTVDGKSYGVPFHWGANVLLYSTQVFGKAPASWSVVFEEQKLPDGKSNKGRVQAYDAPIYIADAALYLMKKQPALGITDPYELNEKQYAAVLSVLKRQHKLVHRYWHDPVQQMADFKHQGVAASSSWSYMVNTSIAGGQAVASTIPAEGATGWADTTMLHAEAKHPNCAYRWLEHSLSPQVQIALSEWFSSLPVVPDACRGKAPKGTDPCKINGFANFDRIHFWRTPTARCKQGTCVPYSQWVTDYVGIMGGKQ